MMTLQLVTIGLARPHLTAHQYDRPSTQKTLHTSRLLRWGQPRTSHTSPNDAISHLLLSYTYGTFYPILSSPAISTHTHAGRLLPASY